VPPLSAVFPLEETGEAAYESAPQRHEGKIGILCVASEEGLASPIRSFARASARKRLTIFVDTIRRRRDVAAD